MPVVLEDHVFEAVESVLKAADALATSVIRGDKGQQAAALLVARRYGELRRLPKPQRQVGIETGSYTRNGHEVK